MRRLFLVPKAVLDAKILGPHEAMQSGSDPNLWLVVVEGFPTLEAEDRFEAYPGVVELRQNDYGKTVPPNLMGFADPRKASISPTDTLEAALWKVRVAWPPARL